MIVAAVMAMLLLYECSHRGTPKRYNEVGDIAEWIAAYNSELESSWLRKLAEEGAIPITHPAFRDLIAEFEDGFLNREDALHNSNGKPYWVRLMESTETDNGGRILRVRVQDGKPPISGGAWTECVLEFDRKGIGIAFKIVWGDSGERLLDD